MLAPLSWIKEFVDIKVTPEALAEKLSMAGLEVEALQNQGEGLSQVFTAKILKMAKHPDADKLTLCEVQCGEDLVPVVCGAKNMKVGDVVALARPGAKLPNGLQIKSSKIRGEISEGMLCSESELGLATTSEGILILPTDTKIGQPLGELLGLQDTVLKVNVTPNRGDCLSIVGLAREVAANYGLSFQELNSKKEDSFSLEKDKLEIKVKVPLQCKRYTAQILRGVKIGPSPKKIAQRLEASGIRSINNVVDAANYVMLETGQPFHAFDLSQLQGGLQVRLALDGEKITTFEGKEYQLQGSDLVIADTKHPLALAGVMGGLDSGVSEATTDLLLESACFNPSTVRKTARRLGVATDSSYRFERGVDPNNCLSALVRLTQLIQKIAGGELEGVPIDIYPEKISLGQITLREARLKKILGISLTNTEILTPLQALGISGKEIEPTIYSLSIPTYRSDLTREIDVIEEVARLYGYGRIPTHYPQLSLEEIPSAAPNRFDRLDEIRQLLMGWGFTETLHYSFTSPKLLSRFGLEVPQGTHLHNPISEELSVMRPALFPQMVETLQQNLFRGAKHLKFFELRPVYLFTPEASRFFQEEWHLCLALAGTRRPEHFLEKDEKSSNEALQGLNILDLKGYVDILLQYLGCLDLRVEQPGNLSFFHPGQQLRWELKQGRDSKGILGFLGQLHPRDLSQWDLTVPVILAEIKLENFLTESKNRIQFQEISSFPRIGRDLNLVVDETRTHGELSELIKAHGGSWLKQVELFDVYRGKPLPEGKKALTYRLEYGSYEGTLTDDEVNRAREKLLTKLGEVLGAMLR